MTNPAENTPANDAAEVQQSLDTIADTLQHLQRFVTRRFDEVSMEINATSQLLGMAEDGISQRFAEVLGVLSAVSFHGDGATPHNVGVELDAVVKTTEEAANRILDSASEISDLTRTDIDWNDPAARAVLMKKIDGQASQILTACAFQDLTGQRIGKTLENIRKAEAELSDTLKRMGLKIEDESVRLKSEAVSTHNVATSQADIDAMFG